VRNPLPGTRCHSRRSCCAAELLVAGFHPRFGPPSPFSTTLTVYASAHPVTCFSHSRPWGWAPVSLLRVQKTSARRRTNPDARGRCLFTREAPGRCVRPAACAANRSPHRSGRKRPVRLRLPDPFASARVRCLPFDRPKAPDRPSRGSFAVRVAPLDRYGSHRSPLAPTPYQGFLSRVLRSLERVLPRPGTGLPGTNRVVSDSVRFALPTRRALARPAVRVCQLFSTASPTPLTADAGASSVRRPGCRQRGLVIDL
jgi:hypothetical protein